MKKKRRLLLVIFLLISLVSLGPVTCFALDCDDDDFDFDFDFAPLDPQELIVASLRSLIQKPLWERTNLPNGRDVLYLMPYKIANIEYGGIAFNIFYNSTNRMPVTIGELFNTECIDIALEGVVELLSDSSSMQEVMAITPLLKKITLQERKVGGLIQAGVILGPFILEIHTSLQLAERNFWLSLRDQEIIRQIIARNFPDGDAAFCTDDLVRYRFGLGDTRVKFGLNLVNLRRFQVDIGLEGIFPTSKFSTSSRVAGNVSTEPEDFIGVLLKRIQQTILKPRLGNGGHVGLGVYIESKVNLVEDKVDLWNRLSFDNYFPGEQDRLVLFARTISPEDLTIDNLPDFLQQYLFPPVFKVDVRPGSIINFVTGIDCAVGDFNIGFGYDFYYQRPEKLSGVECREAPRNQLLIDRATAPRAIQHKLFGDVVYSKSWRKCDFFCGLGGDATVSSEGIGRDWTIYGKIGILF